MVAHRERLAVFHLRFVEDLAFFVRNERKVASKLLELVFAVMRDPFGGIGKPEPLKNLGPNTWSRRLTQEDRIVYVVGDDRIYFTQARYHY